MLSAGKTSGRAGHRFVGTAEEAVMESCLSRECFTCCMYVTRLLRMCTMRQFIWHCRLRTPYPGAIVCLCCTLCCALDGRRGYRSDVQGRHCRHVLVLPLCPTLGPTGRMKTCKKHAVKTNPKGLRWGCACKRRFLREKHSSPAAGLVDSPGTGNFEEISEQCVRAAHPVRCRGTRSSLKGLKGRKLPSGVSCRRCLHWAADCWGQRWGAAEPSRTGQGSPGCWGKAFSSVLKVWIVPF